MKRKERDVALFRPTYKNVLEPEFVQIVTKIDGKSSSSLPGILDVKIESFKDPVTGAEQETEIQLPKWFIFKLADAAKSEVMRISTRSLNFDDSGHNAFFAPIN